MLQLVGGHGPGLLAGNQALAQGRVWRVLTARFPAPSPPVQICGDPTVCSAYLRFEHLIWEGP